ncbi:MASE1 domain-containing protein [Streptomyces sp. bgisy022]|uniref:MASE1 domain-containing protein n=1 Tax=Streptomyces sp. bgisy022 TaxID=3413769 RepID=UPI003D71EEDA
MSDVTTSLDPRAAAVHTVRTLAIAACYYAAGRLGLLRELIIQDSVVSPIWPPTGVATAALLVYGLRACPGIALGSLGIILTLTTSPQLSALGLVAGNTAAPVCGYLMLRRVGFRTDLARLRDGLSLVFLGAFGAMLISSGTGAGLLAATAGTGGQDFWPLWLSWWVGDAMGVLIVTPVLLLLHRLHRHLRRPWPRVRWREAVGLALVAGCLVTVATHSPASLLFLVYPLVIWAALRFQLAGSMLCVLLASVMATVAATEGTGPFRDMTRVEVMLNLQAFNGAIALTALLLSAVIAEQHHTRRSVERACQELMEVLEHLTAGDTAPARPGTAPGNPRPPDHPSLDPPPLDRPSPDPPPLDRRPPDRDTA